MKSTPNFFSLNFYVCNEVGGHVRGEGVMKLFEMSKKVLYSKTSERKKLEVALEIRGARLKSGITGTLSIDVVSVADML